MQQKIEEIITKLEQTEIKNFEMSESLKNKTAESEQTAVNLKKKSAYIDQLKQERNFAREDFREEMTKSTNLKLERDELSKKLDSTQLDLKEVTSKNNELEISNLKLSKTNEQLKTVLEVLQIDNDKLRNPKPLKEKDGNKENILYYPQYPQQARSTFTINLDSKSKNQGATKPLYMPLPGYAELEFRNTKLMKELNSLKSEHDKMKKTLDKARSKSRGRSRNRLKSDKTEANSKCSGNGSIITC